MPFWKKSSRRISSRDVKVTIYSKPECHLCEQAKAQLERLQKQHGFHLEEVDISRDAKLLVEFETRIPLIWVNDHLVGKYHVDEEALMEHVRRASAETVKGNERIIRKINA
jgi:glutaredoxin